MSPVEKFASRLSLWVLSSCNQVEENLTMHASKGFFRDSAENTVMFESAKESVPFPIYSAKLLLILKCSMMFLIKRKIIHGL